MDENEKLKEDIAGSEYIIACLLGDIKSATPTSLEITTLKRKLEFEMTILGDKEFELETRLQLAGMRLFHGQ